MMDIWLFAFLMFCGTVTTIGGMYALIRLGQAIFRIAEWQDENNEK